MTPQQRTLLDYRSITVLRKPSSPQSARWLLYPRGDSGWGALTSPGCWINKAPCLLTGRQATFYNYDGELIIFPCYVCLFCYFPFLSSLVSSVVLLPVLVIPPFFVPVLWSSPVSQCRSSWLFSCVLLFILPPPLNLTFSYKHIPFTLVIGVLYYFITFYCDKIWQFFCPIFQVWLICFILYFLFCLLYRDFIVSWHHLLQTIYKMYCCEMNNRLDTSSSLIQIYNKLRSSFCSGQNPGIL